VRCWRISERAAALAVTLALAAGEPAAQLRTPSQTGAPPPRTAGCTFVVVAGFYFGAYDDGSSNSAYSTATFEMNCNAVSGPITFSSGPSSRTGDFQNRRMSGPAGDELRYQLFVNAARTVVWGDGSRDTSPIIIPAGGTSRTATAYAEIFGGQWGSQGEYGDTITVSITP
jgi:spore coat protein U-like protein